MTKEEAIKIIKDFCTFVIKRNHELQGQLFLDQEEIDDLWLAVDYIESIINRNTAEWIESDVLPTYSVEQTENPTKDIYSAIEYWKSVDEDNNMVKWLTELQEYRKSEREKAEKTAEWITKWDEEEREERHYCTNCNKYQLFQTELCSHCGAKMKEVEE